MSRIKIVKESLYRMNALYIILAVILSIAFPLAGNADETELFITNVKPNVLLILDNSNSMDEDFLGNAIGSYKTGSRSVEARRALINAVNNYADSMRLGLMSYDTPSASKYYLHNALYFASYNNQTYCPSPPAECLDYCYCHGCRAGMKDACLAACQAQNPSFVMNADYSEMDQIIDPNRGGAAADSDKRKTYCKLIYPKTNRITNPADTSNYIYYKLPGTSYSGSNDGTKFCYSEAYSTDEYPTKTNSYKGYTTKTGTNDGNVGYSGLSFTSGFVPTDEDVALGFNNFGQRMMWYYTSRCWFSNSSPGGGYLHVQCADNPNNDSQLNALLAKLATKENDEAGYISCTKSNKNECAYIINAGLTPTVGTFTAALNYFKGVSPYNGKSPITNAACQKNYIIYVTDGLPSVNASGTKDTAANLMPDVLTKIDELRAITSGTYTLDVKTYILGVALTDDAKPKLDDMAVHGGTAVSGKAYYADNAAAITTALKAITNDIISNSFSFTTASISSSRLADENYIYEASFLPTWSDPFWKGYLKKYSINADGSLGSVQWEAGLALKGQAGTSRNMYTYKSASLITFNSTNVGYSDLDVADTTAAESVIRYIRGESPEGDLDNWKLGDIFHSQPITVGTPSPYFADFLDTSSSSCGTSPASSGNGFYCFRALNQRSSALGNRLVVLGANDGQVHALKASDGTEFWSFIPPNLLPKLKYLAHSVEPAPTDMTHQFFVDGPVTVADVWLGTGIGTSKTASEWKTIGIFSLGRDADFTGNLLQQVTKNWSSSASCDSGLSDTYSATYSNFCGYWAFDFTGITGNNNPSVISGWTTPTLKVGAYGPYFGKPWGKMAIGRAKISGNEKWLGFVAGGYDSATASASTCNTSTSNYAGCRGKGVFVVDLTNGNVIWSYNYGSNPDMSSAIVAPMSIVDADSDGFVDSAYVGDINGDVWQFRFCRASDGDTCSTSNWKGSLLVTKTASKQPIYTQITVAKDNLGDVWLYWGTGDKTAPTNNDPAGYVWGLKGLYCTDTGLISGNPSPCNRNDMDNITSSQGAYCSSSKKVGWYINLAGNSEKVLAEPVAFGNVLYFTTFVPGSGADLCKKSGDSYLYAINIANTAGICSIGTGAISGARSIYVGKGIASAPVVSLKPGTAMPVDLYVTTSGGIGYDERTIRVPFDPPTMSNRTNMLYWKDRRLQN